MRILSLFSLAALVSLPAVTFAATPAISSVTGTVQAGEILTVTGSNMNNENKTNWDAFFVTHPNASSFEGPTPVADGYSVIGPPGGSYDTTVSLLGSKSMKFHVQGASSTLFNQLGDYQAIDPAGGDHSEWWARAYVRWNLSAGNWPSGHIKMLYNLDGYYFQPTGEGAGRSTLPSTMIAIYNGGTHYISAPNTQLENGRWYSMELHWKTVSDQSASNPGIYEAWIDGRQVVSAQTIDPMTANNYLLFGVINTCCTDSAFNLDNWFDGLAVGTSRIYPSALVEIGNRSNYATATKQYQAPLFISDGSVKIKADLMGLGAGPYYLWVTNNRQERSQAYVLGQGDGNNPLDAPLHLRVQ